MKCIILEFQNDDVILCANCRNIISTRIRYYESLSKPINSSAVACDSQAVPCNSQTFATDSQQLLAASNSQSKPSNSNPQHSNYPSQHSNTSPSGKSCHQPSNSKCKSKESVNENSLKNVLVRVTLSCCH